MATSINAPMAGEIWHLSIEDLFQPVTEVQRLGGDGPFVINLSVSTALINTPTKAFDVCRDAHIYQIQVTEDGRTRYRLRLGPFANEDQADAVLAEVRETYPGALTATAGPADLRVIASMQPKVEPKLSEAQRLQAQVATKETAEAESEISIDMAWHAPELVVPVDIPLLAVPGVTLTVAPKSENPPAAVLPVELAPEWALPELDIPLQKSVAAGSVAKAPTPGASPRAAESVSTPIPIAVDAPVLTEAVVPKPKPATAASQAKPAAFAPKAAAFASKTPPTAVAASRAAAPGAG
ncbi:MAG: SPOR domain-containing protein, partial [Pseudomonadota bacterium]|nr:SPOR domain-containing protein [Pseudomonadota bacterium]